MKTLLKFLAVLGLLAFTTLVGRADPISGNVALGIGNDVSPQWDVTGGYNLAISQQGASFELRWIMVMEPSGKYTGTATLLGNLTQGFATNQVNVNFDFAGKVSKQGGVVTVPLKLRGKGVYVDTGVGSFVTGSATMMLSGNLVIDKDTLAMEGPLAGSFTTNPAGKGASMTTALNLGNVSVNLQNGMTGSWQLLLENMSLDAHKRYSGNAQVVLSDGRTFDFGLTGSYAPHTRISRVALKGMDAAQGMNLVGQFTYDANGQTLGIARKMTGKILTGQPLTVAATTSNIALTPIMDGSGAVLTLGVTSDMTVWSNGFGGSGSVVVGDGGNDGNLTISNGGGILVGGGILDGGDGTILITDVNSSFFGDTPVTIDGVGNFAHQISVGSSNINDTGTGSMTVEDQAPAWPVPDGTVVIVYANGIFNLQNGGNVTVPSGTAIYIHDGGQLNVDGNNLNIEDGGFLVMENGDDLTITNGGSVTYANPDDVLITNAGNLTIENGTINNNLVIGSVDSGTLTISSGGIVSGTSTGSFSTGDGDAHVVVGSNPAFTVDGVGNFTQSIEINDSSIFEVADNVAYTLQGGTVAVINAQGTLGLVNGGTLTVANGAAVYIKDGGQLNVDAGNLNIEEGGFLVMENGDDLTITNGGSVTYANPDNVLITNAGNLTIANGTITNNQDLVNVDNGGASVIESGLSLSEGSLNFSFGDGSSSLLDNLESGSFNLYNFNGNFSAGNFSDISNVTSNVTGEIYQFGIGPGYVNINLGQIYSGDVANFSLGVGDNYFRSTGVDRFTELSIGRSQAGALTLENGAGYSVPDYTTLTVFPMGTVTVGANCTLTVPSQAALDIKDGGKLIVEDGGTLVIEDGGFLAMDNGDDLTIANGGTVSYANPDYVLITNAGNLTIANGTITNNPPPGN